MKKAGINILWVLLYIITSCSVSSSISKCTVPFADKGEITLNCTDTENGTHLTLETSDPVALRTLLMQGFQLQLYGVATDTTIVAFPSAKDVGNKITHHPGEVKATIQGEREKRPDMRPLVAALNEADVLVSRNGLGTISLQKEHDVSINPSNGMLSYNVIIPNDFVIDGDYAITLLSQPDSNMVEKGEFTSKGYVSRSSESHQQPFGVNDEDGNTDQRKTIKVLFKFNK